MSAPLSPEVVCGHCSAINRVAEGRPRPAAKCGKCGQSLFDGQPITVTDTSLWRHVEKSGLPLLLDVWAPWCGPCKAMAPNFASAARDLAESVRFLKLNSDEAPQASQRLGVRGIPALYLFQDGQVAAQTAGLMSASQLKAWVAQGLAKAP